MNEVNSPDDLMTPAEVAKRLGVSPVTVRSWVAKGWLNSQRTAGGHRRFRWDEVEKLVTNRPRHKNSSSDKIRILVVDDDPQFRNYLLEALAVILPGAALRYAADGFQAGIVMASFHPDLVLLDYAIPGLNGASVYRIIRSDPAYAKTRIVAITGLPSEESLHDLHNVGAKMILHKPLGMDKIKQMLVELDIMD